MKNYMKKIIALVLVCIMIIPMGLISSFALEADESVTANWNTLAAKYSAGTWDIIAPKSNEYKIRTEGFTFTEAENGGIKVTTPDYETLKGTYGVSAVTSNTATPLDGLSVVITPDEYDSFMDTADGANNLNILWTEEKIEAIAGFNEASKKYDSALFSAVPVLSNGLRHLIPIADADAKLIPASQVPELANGKALFIRVGCSKEMEDGAPIATSVTIVYYDGYYINDDGHPGYRWTFTAKNHEDTLLGDSTVISRGYESIDLRNGLAVNVRADDTLGYIVNINGYDFYKGEEVGFFPDCDVNWVGYKTNELTDEEIRNGDPIWTTSMTYARADVDLSGLKDAGNGYLTVGAVSNNDKNIPEHRCNYTIDSINGVPAAAWAGEATAAHECNFELVTTIGATCTRDGYDYYRCTVCGAAKNENIVPALGHYPKEDITVIAKPTCTTYGSAARVCYVCRERLEMIKEEPIPHTFTKDWTGDFTCEAGGTRTNTCDVCSSVVTETLEPGHIYEWVETTPATCGSEGVETETCSVCGATSGETRAIPVNSDVHSEGEWEPVVVDNAWDGLEKTNCTICGEEFTRTVDVYDYVKHFADVKKGQWYVDEVAYCVQMGYVSGMSATKFAPNKNLSRAEFLTLLAKVDGVDLSVYEGKDSGFTDVKPKHWFNTYVCWAVENEITSGLSETKFGPNNEVTRAQLARFFYVYTQMVGGDVTGAADISGYPDASKVQSWAKAPVEWAVDAGLISGVTKGGVVHLDPNGKATRAQAARMIMVYTQIAVCEHVWGEWEVVTPATYEAAGEEQRACTLCGVTETKEIPMLVCTEHTWGEWVVTLEPTKEAEGKQERTCSTCGKVEEDILPVLPDCTHEWSEWVTTTEPTTETEGAAERECTLCGETETKVLPIVKMFTLEFIDGDYVTDPETNVTSIVGEVIYSVGANIDDAYADIIDELPVLEKEGYVFKGWWNRARRIAITPGSEKTFDVYIKNDDATGLPSETIDEVEKTIQLVPIWDTEGEKDWTIRFENWDIDGFEPLVYKMNVGDTYMSIFAGDFPSPDVYEFDEWTKFVGWYIEDLNFLLTEGDMWDLGYLALADDWTFIALYQEV